MSNLRVGCTVLSFLDAAAEACYLNKVGRVRYEKDFEKEEVKIAKKKVREKYDLSRNDVTYVLEKIVEGGIEGLDGIRVRTFYAIASMLGSPVNSIEAILTHYGSESITCEWKYDGVRCQIHYDDGIIKVFNRHSEENTDTWRGDVIPYLLEKLEGREEVKSFILDVEVVAVARRDLENVRILPFQTLSTRKRKSPGDESTTTTNTTSSGSEVDVCVYAFDCLYLNAEILVDLELSERREHLDTVLEVVGSKGYFDRVTSINVSLDVMEVDDGEEEDEAKPSPDEEIKSAFEEAVKNKCEGLMLKSTKSKYEAGARGGWLKLKKDYIDGLCDTLDVVPIGAWRGTGRKAEKGFFSPWLVAVYDKQNDKFESICRLLSLTDEMYTSKTEFYRQRLLEKPSDRVNSRETNCYFWEPCEVWEIKGADLTASPVHSATLGIAEDDFGDDGEEGGRGIGLRFPRFVRERKDKGIEEATTSEEILRMFQAQRE
ncbi:hypothetical protein TrVE_jg11469 [Triparma verrucosa]|nr:hypothetical protein TrVE_jg11469 [Triparma verrucosa]